MLLASVSALVTDLGFDPMPDITAAVTAALHSAEATLSSRLGTEFSSKTDINLFFVREPGWSSGGYNETKFRLKQGMVKTNSVMAIAATSLANLGGDDAITPELIVDYELGQVTDPSTLYNNHFVQITYQYGFDDTGNDQYELDQVPDWLERAAIVQAKIELASHPTITAANIKLDPISLRHELDAILSKRLRYMPLAILSI